MSLPKITNLEIQDSLHEIPTKLYHSVGQIIRSNIQSGEWAAGQQIPSERKLVEILGVSRATVRQGIENLVKEGILVREHGRGTFVAPPKIKQGILRLLEFFDIMKRSGMNPSAQLLGHDTITPSLLVRNILNLPEKGQAFWFRRLLQVNGQPSVIETSYLPSARFAGLLDHFVEYEDIHKLLSQYYGVKINKVDESFEPVILEHEEASLLAVNEGFAALWVESVASDMAGNPILYMTSLLRGDRCRFYIELTVNQ
jgi:GntR family transcriptional regulator, N-acetylglucosamine utilization regulator